MALRKRIPMMLSLSLALSLSVFSPPAMAAENDSTSIQLTEAEQGNKHFADGILDVVEEPMNDAQDEAAQRRNGSLSVQLPGEAEDVGEGNVQQRGGNSATAPATDTAPAVTKSDEVEPPLIAPQNTQGTHMSIVRTDEDADGATDVKISMTEERAFQAVVSFDNLTEDELKQAKIQWTLARAKEEAPNDWALFPNQYLGARLEDWKTVHTKHKRTNEEFPSVPLFKDVTTEVKTIDGKPSIVLTFKNEKLFGFDGIDIRDRAVVRSAMMDYWGKYHLSLIMDDKAVTSQELDFRPYDVFRSQEEVNEELPKAVEEAKENGIFAKVVDMGKSAQDRPMRAVFVSESEDDLVNYQKLKKRIQEDPQAVLKELRDGTLEYKVPVMYSNIHADEIVGVDAVMEFMRNLTRNKVVDYRTITGLTEEGKKELAIEMEKDGAVWSKLIEDKVSGIGYIRGNGGMSNGSNYDGGIDASADLSEEDFERYYNSEIRQFDPRQILKKMFFILVPSENVDARTVNSRTNGNGFDLNRDNTYQTQPETQAMARLISQWNPLTLHEFHGYYQYYQIEPCSPTHDPNNEYDLFIDTAMEQGEAFAAASVSNNKTMNSAKIPLRDYLLKQEDGTTFWQYPFDDMSSSYTPQYAMMHGTNAFTVESAYGHADGVRALQYGCIGNADFVLKNRDRMFGNQLLRYVRGVENIDADTIRPYYVDQHDNLGANADVFRPNNNENKNFFPEYYVIPMDAKNQQDRKAAQETISLLLHNDVQVNQLTKDVKVGDKVYKQGSVIVAMRQVKRNMANQVLYPNMVISDWTEGSLYSEPVTNFSALRGFSMDTIRKADVFKGAMAPITTAPMSRTVIEGKGDVSIIKNNSLEAVRAVNAILANKGDIALITDGKWNGSFATTSKTLDSVKDRFVLDVMRQGDVPEGRLINTDIRLFVPKAYDNVQTLDQQGNPVGMVGYRNRLNTSGNWDFFALAKQMGFGLTDTLDKATGIVGGQYPYNSDDVAAQIKKGTPYIGYSSDALQFVKDSGLADLKFRLDEDWKGFDALSKVEFPTEDLATATYVQEGDHIMYGFGGDYFLEAPDGSRIIIRTMKEEMPLEGFMTEEYMKDYKGSIQAVVLEKDGKMMRLFANTLTNKAHQQDDYRYLSTSIYAQHLLNTNLKIASNGQAGKTDKVATTPKATVAPKTSDIGIQTTVFIGMVAGMLYVVTIKRMRKEENAR